MLAIIICFLVIIFDQLSKLWVLQNIKDAASIDVVGKALQFVYVENRGAAFGILQGRMILFYLVTAFVIGILIYILVKEGKNSRYLNIAIGLLMGGAIGNLIDRIRLNYVVDFIKVDLVDFYFFPVFNIADIAVTIGAFLLILYILFFEKKWKREEKNER